MLKRMVVLSFLLLLGLAVSADASTIGTITVDTAPVLEAATVIITALASVWAIRKVIKTVNKS